MPRRQSKHAPVKVQATLRQREAAELRAQKLTMQEIADRLGISKPAVFQLLERWDENFRQENAVRAEQIRDAQLDELRLLRNEWWPRVRDPKASSKDLAAYMKILDHEANLAGAKAPTTTKTELTGKDGAALAVASTSADLSHLTTEQLETLAAWMSQGNPDTPAPPISPQPPQP